MRHLIYLCITLIVTTVAYSQTGDFEDIQELILPYWKNCDYEKVLAICDSLGVKKIVDNDGVEGYAAYWRSKALYELGNVEEASAEIQRGRQIFKNLGPAYLGDWMQCTQFHALIQYDQAGVDKAIEGLSEIVNAGNENERQKLLAMGYMANFHSEAGRFQIADSLLAEAEKWLGKTVDSLSFEAGRFYLGKAAVRLRQFKLTEARRYAERGHRIIVSHPGSAPADLMASFNNLALAYANINRREEGQRLLEKALNMGFCNGTTAKTYSAMIHRNLAESFIVQGKYRYAEKHLQQALKLLKQAHQTEHVRILGVYGVLAKLYATTGDTTKTKFFGENGLEMAKSLGLERSQFTCELLFSLQHVEADLKVKLEHVLRVYHLSKSLFGPMHFQVIASAMEVSATYARLGNREQALKYHRIVNDILKAFGSHPIIPDLYTDFAETSVENNNLKRASSFLDTSFYNLNNAAEVSSQVYDVASAIPNLFYQGARISQKKWEESKDTSALITAHQQFAQALQGVRFIIPISTSPQEKNALVSQLYDIYEAAIENALKIREEVNDTKWDDIIFSLVEESKNVVLKSQAPAFLSNIPDSAKRELIQLNTSILLLHRSLMSIKSADEINSINEHLKQQKNKYSRLKHEVEQNYQGENNSRFADPLSITQIQSQIPGGRVMVEYFLVKGNLFAFLISKKQYRILDLGKYAPVRSGITNHRSLIRSFSSEKDKSKNARLCDRTAQKLYEALLKPVLEVTSGIEELIIVPDKEIHYLPFEALIDENGTYLIEYPFVISYGLSSSLIFHEPKVRAKKTMAWFSPDYSNQAISYTDTLKSGVLASLVRSGALVLPASALEREEIQNDIRADMFYGDRATKSAFLEAAPQYRILHFSMHGFVEEEYPMLSFLLFQNENEGKADEELLFLEEGSRKDAKKNEPDEEKLFLGEVYQLELQADLAMLTACHTGSGPMSNGEGIISFARAFRYAGVPATITGLWNLPDRTTSQITLSFYDGLASGLSKAEALKRAKLNYLSSVKEPVLSHPYFWAGVVLHGNPGPVEVRGDNPKMLLLVLGIAGILILVLGFLYSRKKILSRLVSVSDAK